MATRPSGCPPPVRIRHLPTLRVSNDRRVQLLDKSIGVECGHSGPIDATKLMPAPIASVHPLPVSAAWLLSMVSPFSGYGMTRLQGGSGRRVLNGYLDSSDLEADNLDIGIANYLSRLTLPVGVGVNEASTLNSETRAGGQRHLALGV